MTGIAGRTQVGIVGAGPAGLVLAHMLHRQGIETVVLEARTREYIEQRVRAGVLENATVDLLTAIGLGDRLRREGIVHDSFAFRFDRRDHRITLSALTGGRRMTVYGQEELTKDLVRARLDIGDPLVFEAEVLGVDAIETSRPTVRYRHEGVDRELRCDFVAGCDGFHGACRRAMHVEIYERAYPLAWLGILAAVPASVDEAIYAQHEHGFALQNVRSPKLTRLHLQCRRDEDLEAWPDERIWDELDVRLAREDGQRLARGPILMKSIIPLRSFVAEPMRQGRLLLAGDAAHIVPPTGAKGLNLAIGDVGVLAEALTCWYESGDERLLGAYSATRLRRVWHIQRFSSWMTWMLHRFPEHDAFDRKLQRAQLDHICSSDVAARELAEAYVGRA